MQASLDAARHWRFRPPDHAPATTLIGFNIALAQRPVPGGPIRNIPTWASAFVNRALMDQWGMPSITLVAPVAMQTASGALIDVSIDANGTPVSACALGPIDQLTVPALQTALAWRFMGRSDGTTYLTMVSLHFTKQPRKIKDVRPVYPAAAMKKHVTGTVQVEVMIGVDGRVSDATVVKSIPALDDAALTAVRQWQFAPALRDGIPVAQKSTITVAFALK
jgi:TonB family protein